jgi:2-polyprenyl-6-methoxyphenol hydroxylase-like FAD-dependent oxidoreductase
MPCHPSPGINLAIQNAVAAANLLVQPLLDGRVTTRHLARVQRRRSLPARLTQRVQLLVQKHTVPRTDGVPATDVGVRPGPCAC